MWKVSAESCEVTTKKFFRIATGQRNEPSGTAHETSVDSPYLGVTLVLWGTVPFVVRRVRETVATADFVRSVRLGISGEVLSD
jgi:hypothetical protein